MELNLATSSESLNARRKNIAILSFALMIRLSQQQQQQLQQQQLLLPPPPQQQQLLLLPPLLPPLQQQQQQLVQPLFLLTVFSF